MDLIQKFPNFRINNIYKNTPLVKLLGELNIFYPNIKTQDKEWIYKDAEKSYKNLILKHHPDKGGDPEICSYLNTIWATIKERLNGENKIKNSYNYETIPLQDILCLHCKRKFIQKQPKQKFCCLKCQGKYHNWWRKRV